ncbi:golgin subfamily A member 4-like [Latimeria chalumnae]|uniref:golgin subfamily A member 4-like n=1 Tax=Latimeria chalumnae TaxID=7897 RepID=UPI0003C19EA1
MSTMEQDDFAAFLNQAFGSDDLQIMSSENVESEEEIGDPLLPELKQVDTKKEESILTCQDGDWAADLSHGSPIQLEDAEEQQEEIEEDLVNNNQEVTEEREVQTMSDKNDLLNDMVHVLDNVSWASEQRKEEHDEKIPSTAEFERETNTKTNQEAHILDNFPKADVSDGMEQVLGGMTKKRKLEEEEEEEDEEDNEMDEDNFEGEECFESEDQVLHLDDQGSNSSRGESQSRDDILDLDVRHLVDMHLHRQKITSVEEGEECKSEDLENNEEPQDRVDIETAEVYKEGKCFSEKALEERDLVEDAEKILGGKIAVSAEDDFEKILTRNYTSEDVRGYYEVEDQGMCLDSKVSTKEFKSSVIETLNENAEVTKEHLSAMKDEGFAVSEDQEVDEMETNLVEVTKGISFTEDRIDLGLEDMLQLFSGKKTKQDKEELEELDATTEECLFTYQGFKVTSYTVTEGMKKTSALENYELEMASDYTQNTNDLSLELSLEEVRRAEKKEESLPDTDKEVAKADHQNSKAQSADIENISFNKDRINKEDLEEPRSSCSKTEEVDRNVEDIEKQTEELGIEFSVEQNVNAITDFTGKHLSDKFLDVGEFLVETGQVSGDINRADGQEDMDEQDDQAARCFENEDQGVCLDDQDSNGSSEDVSQGLRDILDLEVQELVDMHLQRQQLNIIAEVEEEEEESPFEQLQSNNQEEEEELDIVDLSDEGCLSENLEKLELLNDTGEMGDQKDTELEDSLRRGQYSQKKRGLCELEDQGVCLHENICVGDLQDNGTEIIQQDTVLEDYRKEIEGEDMLTEQETDRSIMPHFKENDHIKGDSPDLITEYKEEYEHDLEDDLPFQVQELVMTKNLKAEPNQTENYQYASITEDNAMDLQLMSKLNEAKTTHDTMDREKTSQSSEGAKSFSSSGELNVAISLITDKVQNSESSEGARSDQQVEPVYTQSIEELATELSLDIMKRTVEILRNTQEDVPTIDDWTEQVQNQQIEEIGFDEERSVMSKIQKTRQSFATAMEVESGEMMGKAFTEKSACQVEATIMTSPTLVKSAAVPKLARGPVSSSVLEVSEEESLADLQEELLATQKKLQNSQEMNFQLEGKVQSLEKKYQVLESSYKKLQRDYEDVFTNLTLLERELVSSREKCCQYENELAIFKAQYVRQEDTGQAQLEEGGRQQEMQTEAEEELTVLKRKNSQIVQESRTLVEELSRIQKELRGLRKNTRKSPSYLKSLMKISMVVSCGILFFWWATDQLE